LGKYNLSFFNAGANMKPDSVFAANHVFSFSYSYYYGYGYFAWEKQKKA
jgi:hypothetical protein